MVALKVGPVVLLVVKAESFYDRLKPYLKEHPDFHAAARQAKIQQTKIGIIWLYSGVVT